LSIVNIDGALIIAGSCRDALTDKVVSNAVGNSLGRNSRSRRARPINDLPVLLVHPVINLLLVFLVKSAAIIQGDVRRI